MDRKTTMLIGALIVGGILGFFGGVKYQQNKTPAVQAGRGGQFAGAAGGAGRRGGANGMSFANGQVLSQDNNSITVKLMNGGSQIVLLAPSTQYRKAVDGSASDVIVGSNVTITGTSNSDGSLTAQAVQIRSASSTPAFLGR